MIAPIRTIGAEATATVERLAALADEGPEGHRYPERWASNALGRELLVRIDETVAEWAMWAEAEVSSWPTVRRSGREVAAGPIERGAPLLAAVADRAKD